MLSCRFVQSFLGLAGLKLTPDGVAIAKRGQRRSILLQTSPVAEFQYHSGNAVWGGMRVGQALTLVREPLNPYDAKAVRVDWRGHKLGYVPRTENHAVAQLLDRGEKLSARIVELNDENSDSWEWEWERVRFEVLLEAEREPKTGEAELTSS